MNRPLTITIPGNGEIAYNYDAAYLRSVTRTSSDINYSHVYEKYDLAGNPLSETFYPHFMSTYNETMIAKFGWIPTEFCDHRAQSSLT